ncbi:hypothetical protein SK571_23115 [Lentzea sp. BCCO 10_0798]|uniref:Uncharacterized protein n=1 Tax=Lentzea kristufekii TaxID=3095430 RepID=A0ABU4TWM8_9PSEU|nr:hypothetical protein [Lentzea sp. BCCO 10_0798]MDX8052287.1 hypothetical protein [Lentzea sp. BCCO 10_0798]
MRAVMAKPEPTADDLVYLFLPETDTGRTAGRAYLARVSARLAAGGPAVSAAAARGQITAIDKNASVPVDRVVADLKPSPTRFSAPPVSRTS